MIRPVLDAFATNFSVFCGRIRAFYDEIIKPIIDGAAKRVSDVAGMILEVFNSNAEASKKLFQGLGYDWERWWNGLVNVPKTVLNMVLENIENMVNGAIRAINFLISTANETINSINGLFKINIGSIPKWGELELPRLASGAVIPPRQEFMAILGDQRSGTNIEAPLSTIEDAVRSVLAEHGGGGTQEISINFTGNMAQLARALKPHLDAESARQGTSLVMGVN